MKSSTLLLCFTASVCWKFTQGFYKIVAPRVIRPNSQYHVAVSIQGTLVPTTINVTLSGDYPLAQEFLNIPPYTTRIAKFQVGDIPPGDYKLAASGYDGSTVFKDRIELHYLKKSYSVLIQTDRATYRPGNKILFRVLTLNSELLPAADVRNGQQSLNVHISDGEGNIVKQWKNVTANRGVFGEELQLSTSPVLGDWNISVTIRGQLFNKTVRVVEYIFPKFRIDIRAPQHLTFKENVLVAHIKASYDDGRKVVGDATVTVYPTIYSGVIQPIFRNPARKVFPLEGSSSVEFNVENDLKLSDEYERTVVVDVTIEESLTGRRQNNSVQVHLHKYDYKMEMIKTADYFKPGLAYVAYVQVSNHDGSSIGSDKRDVTIRYGYSTIRDQDNYNQVQQKYQLDESGLLKLVLYPPSNASNETALRIQGVYQDLKERMPPVPAAISPSNTWLQASISSKPLTVNEVIQVDVNCTEAMRYITWHVTGRGDVILAGTLQVDNRKEFQFRFTAVHAMVPVSHLVVYYVRDDGELVADSLDIETQGLLQNFIDVEINSVKEEEVEFTIKSLPNSYIGLLAVEETVGSIGIGYDLTREQVAEELELYDNAAATRSPYRGEGVYSRFIWRAGSSNAYDTFEQTGTALLTDARVPNFKRPLSVQEDVYLRPVVHGSSTVKPDRGIGLKFHTITRPPLAGPYAFSRIPRPVWNRPKVYLARDIANTWLFTNYSLGADGKISFKRKLPRTTLNTTWLITGFSLNPLHGLGLVESPKKVEVASNFIVTLSLPHSVQRGETLAVPVVLSNNLDRDITAEVTMHNSEQKFLFADVDDVSTKKIELYRRKKITVKGNSATSVSFMITPQMIGQVEIRVSASSDSNLQQDAARSNLLLVTGEGEREYYTKTLLIDLRKTDTYKGNLTIDLPKNLVRGSNSVRVSLVGDLLAPAMMNLDNLIRLPTGCGEQNLVNFVPNLIALTWLKNTGQLTSQIYNDAISNLEGSYQKQLAYKRMDGSFSAFGKNDVNGSIWITAYVAMSFNQAKAFVYIDEDIITNSLKWLAGTQQLDGSFMEFLPIVHQDVQKSNLALTAFATLAFIENQKAAFDYKNLIDKGLDFIARNLLGEQDSNVYTISICTYVLQVARHPFKQSAFNLLESKAKVENNTKWFGKPVKKEENMNPWNHLPKSLDIETTSYALLSFLEQGYVEDAMPILKWLVNQQNSLGGFASSQDTTIGLYALYKLVSKTSAASDLNMQIDFAYGKQTNRFAIDRSNALMVQEMEIENDVKEVNVSARGQGVALFRVAYQYNMNVTGPWPLFTLDPQVDKNSDVNHLQLSICTAFVSRNLTDDKISSNMAVMEVNLPSGFTADVDALPSLEVSQNVRRVETKNDETTVILYFNNLTVHEYCPTVSAFRTHKVARQKPVAVVVYDYYDTSRRARIFYGGKTASLCDICEGQDCTEVCSSPESQQAEESKDGDGAGIVHVQSWLFILFLALLLLKF